MLLVDINGTPYLADVGFGGATPTAPLRLRADLEQATPHETFRLVGGDPEWRLQMQIGEEWHSVYAFEEIEQSTEDFVALNDRVASDATFRDNLIASRAEKGRRINLRNNELRIHTVGGETETRALNGLIEVKDALAGLFGITLPAAERLDPALTRVLQLPQG